HSERRAPMARPLGHVLTEQHDLSGGGRKNSGDQIEQRRLAGAVRSDDRLAVAGHDLERDVAHGAQAAEALRERPELENRLAAVRVRVGIHLGFPAIASERTGAPATEPRPTTTLIAEFAGREVPAVDRRLEELLLVELPELADVRIGLDDRVPKLFLVIAEHLLLLDLLDVDVLHRVAHLVDGDGTA